MKKIILPLVALGVSLSTMAQAAGSTTLFTFFNGTNKPVLVFVDAESGPDPVFVDAYFPKQIAVNSIPYTVSACWTTLTERWTTSPVCDPHFPTEVSCKNDVESPNTVTAFGNSLLNTAPGLTCTTITATKPQ